MNITKELQNYVTKQAHAADQESYSTRLKSTNKKYKKDLETLDALETNYVQELKKLRATVVKNEGIYNKIHNTYYRDNTKIFPHSIDVPSSAGIDMTELLLELSFLDNKEDLKKVKAVIKKHLKVGETK